MSDWLPPVPDPRIRLSDAAWRVDSGLLLGPVERLEEGYPFLVVYFSRGTLPQKQGKRELLGDLGSHDWWSVLTS